MRQVYFIIVLLMGLLGSFVLRAQQGIIKGKVVDAITREAIAGASVMATGGPASSGAAGVLTDAGGNFVLSAGAADRLVVTAAEYGFDDET